ncbi:hypothetical protein GCM10010156_51670 [Planobispora rosea]|uniref:Helix-turn-helix domain-containing protein n=1 Tax=Planobispora rosea TaxID=35762 RepID=A0A8J3WHY6_PLARO|nr:hypothetical protein GCM10010156_51670 [Planobispora rosea]GIH88321.1 hypothetical protein Pro02_67290 [Planobispora rosea]
MPDGLIPDTLIRVPTLVLWLHVIQSHPDAAGRRADWWRNTTAVVWQLLLHVDSDMVTSPRKGATWELLAAKAGVSRRTFADRLRWLRERGLLHTLVSGSTPRHRPGCRGGRVDDGLGNLAAQYVLTVPRAVLDAMDFEELERLTSTTHPTPQTLAEEPWQDVPWPVEVLPAKPPADLPVEVTCTPCVSMVALSENISPVYAREESGQSGTSPATPERTWPSTVTPENKSQMLQACRRLRDDVPVLRRISPQHLRSLLRSSFSAGATVSDVKYMLNVNPDGRPWGYTDEPRWLPGWIRYRLAPWIDDSGTLLARLPSQAVAEANRRRLREQAERAEQLAEARRNRAAPDPELLAGLRARLEAVRGGVGGSPGKAA